MAYAVQTEVFEGPFDLLLHLILREQVDLYEVRLSRIVDAYLGELERMEGLDLDVATEFLLIAATLLELKSKRLLPGDDDVDLDDELAGDEIAYLVGALRNTHIARLRAASRRIQAEAVPEGFDLPDSRHDDTVTSIHAREILNAVAELPEQYRAAVVAVDLQGQAYDEAAMRLGMPRGTVQSRAFRGRARVARAVGDTNLDRDRLPVY